MCCATRITRTTTRAGWQPRRKPLPPQAAPQPRVRRRCAVRYWWLPRLQCPKLKRPPHSSFYSTGASAEVCRCSGSTFHFHRCPAAALLITCRLSKGEALAESIKFCSSGSCSCLLILSRCFLLSNLHGLSIHFFKNLEWFCIHCSSASPFDQLPSCFGFKHKPEHSCWTLDSCSSL
jgi:hypothetical protein